jgi:hypothetical protein
MSKSLVVVYMGGRGSGKTCSMTVECALAMIAGKPVWSNYPIKFDYFDGEEMHHFESILIDMEALMSIQQNDYIYDGLVALDEWNLFVNSRRSGAMANLVFSGVVQLIRKRKLSFYLSAQDIRTLDRNIRWQTDLTVECFDLSFRYPNLEEGQVISQTVTDWSGVLCGRPLWDSDDPILKDRNTRTRLLNGAKLFWNTYDSFGEFNVLDIMSTKYQLNKHTQIIGKVDDGGGLPNQLNYTHKKNIIQEYRDGLVSMGVDQVEIHDFNKAMNDMGFPSERRGTLGKIIKQCGFSYKKKGIGKAVYYLNKDKVTA